MRRIKDIEAIESDSFVPQAFKSSRDDVKVRPVPLSLPSSHSSLRLIEFTSLDRRMPSVRRRPRPNQTSTRAPRAATRGVSIGRPGVRGPPERRCKHKCPPPPSPQSHIQNPLFLMVEPGVKVVNRPSEPRENSPNTQFKTFSQVNNKNSPVLSCISACRPETFSTSAQDMWSSLRSFLLSPL